MNTVILPIRTPVIAVPPQAPPQENPQNAAPATHPTTNASGARGFAGALDRASAKHSRKDDSTKSGAGKRSGHALPPAGTVSPPASAAPIAPPAQPSLLVGPNGVPAASPSPDDGDDDEVNPASAAPAAAVGTAGVTAATSAPTTPAPGSDLAPSSAPAATQPASPQDAAGAQSAVFVAATDPTQTSADGETDSATTISAASAAAQSSSTSSAASAAALTDAPPAATAINAAGSIPNSVSGAKAQLPASGTGTAAGGRPAAQTSSSAATASTDSAAVPAQTPVASSALVNLALTEGSDATGSAASALQAANAAASSPAPAAAASPFASLQISMTPIGAASGASTASPDASALTASAVVSLDSGGDARGHNGAGDPGSDTGSGFLASGDGTAALQQLTTSTASSTSDAAPVPTVTVHADVDSADFPQGVADKVSLAVDNGWSSAKLSVNPPQLGPIELQIAVQGAHAQVAMSTHSAVTREALESSVPNLRHLLNSQGFTQVSVDISQRSFQERSAPEQPYGRAGGGVRETAPVSSSSVQVSRAPVGMLDTYA